MNRWKKLKGKEVKDKVTGFTGFCTGQTRWMYGCDQYCVTPQIDKDGKCPDSKWFDDGRIEIVGEGINPKEVKVEKGGGCSDHPCSERR